MNDEKTGQPTTNVDEMKFSEVISYGLANVGSGFGNIISENWCSYLMTDVVGIGAGIAGTLMMIGKIFDFFTDFIMGMFIDKTNSKWGSARPWMLWTTIPYAICLFLVFVCPFNGMVAKCIWCFITYNLLVSGAITAYNVPASSFISLATNKPLNRNKLECASMFGTMAVALLISFTINPIAQAFGGGKTGWLMVGVIYGVASILFHYIGFFGIKERVKLTEKNPSFKQSFSGIKFVASNKFVLLVCLMQAMITLNTNQLVLTYYVKYIMNDMSALGYMMVLNMGPSLIMFIISPWLIKQFKSKRLFCIVTMAISILGYACLVIWQESRIALYIATVTACVGASGLFSSRYTFIGDCLDEIEYTTGRRPVGMAYSLLNMDVKIFTALKSAIVGWILAAGGYISSQAMDVSQPASALAAIKTCFIWIPFITFVIALITYCFFTLEKRLPPIREELEKRRAAAVAE